MTGSARVIRSPSSTSLMRSTPCVDGCWGPMLSTMSVLSAAPPIPTMVSVVGVMDTVSPTYAGLMETGSPENTGTAGDQGVGSEKVGGGMAWGWVMLGRNWRSWRYAERADDLLISRGVLWREETVVPYGRMQLVEVTSGPVERHFGLASVQLHTAAAATDATIPGLDPVEAERLRDRLTELGEARSAGLWRRPGARTPYPGRHPLPKGGRPPRQPP